MEIDIYMLISSLLSLTVGTLIGSEVTRYFYKPRVIVRYKDLSPLQDGNGVYWSIQIENYGRSVAKDCIAVVSLYDIENEDILPKAQIETNENLPTYRNEDIDLEIPRAQVVTEDHFRPISREAICWAKLGNPDVIDINPGISQTLDICKYQRSSENSYFIFPSEQGWRKLRVRIKSKDIRGHVLICPSNEFSTRVNFEIKLDYRGESQLKIRKPSRLLRFSKKRFEQINR